MPIFPYLPACAASYPKKFNNIADQRKRGSDFGRILGSAIPPPRPGSGNIVAM
jgi:hypothetical protein